MRRAQIMVKVELYSILSNPVKTDRAKLCSVIAKINREANLTCSTIPCFCRTVVVRISVERKRIRVSKLLSKKVKT